MAPLNKMKGLHLLPSAFPVNQADTRSLSWPVDIIRTSFDPVTSTVQKQPSRGILSKMFPENMQQIYCRTPMPKYDFNKVAKQLY